LKVVSLILPVQSKLKEEQQGGKSSDRFWNLADLVIDEFEESQGGEVSERFWNLPDLVTVEVEVLQGGELSERFSWLFVGFPWVYNT
jgi:hypothetical protein